MLLLLRWLHLAAAVVFVGGPLFLLGFFLPALRSADPEQAHLLLRQLLPRLRRWLGAAAVFLILSGAGLLSAPSLTLGPAYHRVLGMKVLLALAAFATVLAALRPTPQPQPLSPRRTDWLRLGLLLGTIVFLLSSYLYRLRLS